MILISTSGALGRYVTLSPPVTIFYRAIIAVGILYVFARFRKLSFKIGSWKDRRTVVISGIFMGLHWVTYFYALQYSNVAIGMLSIFTYPVITTFLEPIILNTKFQPIHLLLAVIVLVGIYFLVPEFDISNNYTKAVLFGVFSALCYSLRNILLKGQVKSYDGSILMWYQIAVISLALFPFLFFFKNEQPEANEWGAIVLLALLTTSIGHTLFLMSFKHFSITTASLISSAQPVYGILIGILFLNEIPKYTTIIGGILILSTVVIESIRSAKKA
ncbi:EamA family transporter [Spongiivirga citrea]|uniref:EamA family transporter n=2 Tax=Spongiivirga citrea TaxID=1481457 RepID=A0A6M0CLV1_9FLAO|nr:EamA family transporter [Spongiivirga citrea]